VPISPETPASYASSPELKRYSSLPFSPPPATPDAIPYAEALAGNPFQASLSDGESDAVDEEVLENTRRNSALGSRESEVGNDGPDPVKATLARFAAAPRRPVSSTTLGGREVSEVKNQNQPRPALDVDAFKRLLLTGESGVSTSQSQPAAMGNSSQPAVASDSSSSNADTASVSQQSMFEPLAPALTDTPRSSHEFDPDDAAKERERVLSKSTEGPSKPPVPKSHHGKPNQRSATLPTPTAPATTHAHATISPMPSFSASKIPSPTDLNKPLPPPPIDSSFPGMPGTSVSLARTAPLSIRNPPIPPLTRRRSQPRSQTLPESFSASPKSLQAVDVSPLSSLRLEDTAPSSGIPPPPPTRRQKRMSDTGLEPPELTPQEEADTYITATKPELSPSSSMTSLSLLKPQPPPSRNPSNAKRVSRVSSGSPTMAPPPPPPRRARGSNRSSFDTECATLPAGSRPSSEFKRPSLESSRTVSGQSTANDILADLAALQREVDALKNKQGDDTVDKR
jgi:hypothetical protein